MIRNKIEKHRNLGLKQVGTSRLGAISLVFVLLQLLACAPQLSKPLYPDNASILLFSAEVWGGMPFTESQKKNAFLEALSSKSIQRLEQDIPFELKGEANIYQFSAFYEVDASKLPPVLNNGFELVILPINGAKEITLTNKKTGISWLLKLAQNSG